ncbi:MAG: ComEC/Rec2 family competence protein [Acetobacteraceae bacterium]
MRRLHHRRDVLAKMRTHLVMLTATSFFAGLATLPIVAAHFNVVQPWFILANIVAVPIAAIFIMPMRVMALLAMPFHLEGGFLQVMRYGISCINALAEWVTHFPIAQISIPHAPDWAMLVYGVSLYFLCLVRSAWRLAALIGIAVVVASPWLVMRPDILVLSDAALIVVRRGQALYLTKPGFMQKGTAQKWLDDFSLKASAFDDLRHDPEMNCDGDLCLLNVAGRDVLFHFSGPRRASKRTRADFCARSVIKINVASARPLCREAGQIDRFHAWREGAVAIYMGASPPRLVTDRSWRGARLCGSL